MRLRDIIICSLAVILSAAFIIAAGLHFDYLNSQRKEMKLIYNEPLENAPPSLAFATVAMGAFRGLVVDALWMRADRLKEQGQFFDAKQLAEWITTLQPRFVAVWVFQAWNMAYNISVTIPASQPDERWRWIKNGCELLRDKGIPLNPKSIQLYHELARIFQHKISGLTDDDHKYYKLQLALAIQPLLDEPADNSFFDALANAPQTWKEITSDPNVVPLITALKSADKAFADDAGFVNNYLSLRQNPERYNPDAFKVIDAFRGTVVLKKFDIFTKAYCFRNTWKMEPKLMNFLNNNYGPIDWNDPNKHLPLDWRHPDSHAIYWAVKGLQVAGKDIYSFEETNTDRIVVHSLQNLFRYGKIFIHTSTVQTDDKQPHQKIEQEIFLRPDLRMFGPYNKAMLAVLDKYTKIHQTSLEAMQAGHRNMLKNAVLSFYQAGHIRQAQMVYDEMRKLYPLPDFNVPLAAYAKQRLREELTNITIDNAQEIVQLVLRESYFRYAIREDDEAAAREKIAKEAYDIYRSSYSDENRINLPDYKLMKYLALVDLLNDEQYPPTFRQSLLARIKLERPDLFEELKAQAEQLEKKQQQQKSPKTPQTSQ